MYGPVVYGVQYCSTMVVHVGPLSAMEYLEIKLAVDDGRMRLVNPRLFPAQSFEGEVHVYGERSFQCILCYSLIGYQC